MMYRLAIVACLVLGVAACSGYQGVTSGATPARGDLGLNDKQSCVQSCDSAHARCMDAGAARREPDGVAATIYGARSDCEATLRKCLPQCRGR